MTSETDGFILEPIKALLLKLDCTEIRGGDSYRHLRGPWQETDADSGERAVYPSQVLANLQRFYLEGSPGDTPTASTTAYEPFIDVAAYDAAHARYQTEDIRFNFVLDKPIDWTSLEAELALQARSHAFFGPQGHQLLYIEDDVDLLGTTPDAEFSLPGTPDPNTAQGTGPLMERTSTADVANTVRVYFQRNNLEDRTRELQDAYQLHVEQSNADSLAVYGTRYDEATDRGLWAVSPLVQTQGSLYSASGHAGKIANFLAERFAFARTRFAFEAGFPAYGLTAGDLIRVSFAVDRNVFRNVLCEIDSIQTSPINAERRMIVSRSVTVPQVGLSAAFIWTDQFLDDAEQWTTRVGDLDRWEQLWSVP